MSIIPAVFDALLALYGAAPGLAGVDVRDSASPTYLSEEWVLVGPDDVATTAEASDASTQRGGLAVRTPETCRVPCALWTASGVSDPAVHRGRAFELFAAVEAAHATRSGRSLSGAVDNAFIASWRFKARAGGAGAGGQITWVIQARKF